MHSAFGAHAADNFIREANSQAATKRGIKEYNQRRYGAATEAFAKANAYAQSPATLFNLGTAEIAAGKREEGSAALTASMKDKALHADALYNRGNAALAASAYDYAIRDYIDALKLKPADLQTKRNLEIALNRKAQAQQSRSGQQNNPQGSNPQQQQQKNQQQTPSSGQQQRPPQRDANAEALLRAVQQQEQEELQRMKRARAARGRVGW